MMLEIRNVKKRFEELQVLDGISLEVNKVDVVATTFEWKEDIDVERAKNALAEAEALLADGKADDTRREMIMAKRRRADVRLAVAEAE